MKNLKRHAKFYLAILFAAVLVFGTVGIAMAGNLGVEDAGVMRTKLYSVQ